MYGMGVRSLWKVGGGGGGGGHILFIGDLNTITLVIIYINTKCTYTDTFSSHIHMHTSMGGLIKKLLSETFKCDGDLVLRTGSFKPIDLPPPPHTRTAMYGVPHTDLAPIGQKPNVHKE